jgi:ribA/ribD-fused uncharacterized protein
MEYHFFYGGVFSGSYPAMFKVENNVYLSSEQYFIKRKQETFDPNNQMLAIKIMSESDPLKLEQLGKQVANFDQKVWSQISSNIMLKALVFKFSSSEFLKMKLLSTGNKTIVHTSLDKVWGIGLQEKIAVDVKNWPGENLLGKLLMQARKIIRDS